MTRAAAWIAGSRLLVRLLSVIALVTLIVAPAVVPRAAAGEPGDRPFLQLHIDSITPDTVTTTSEPIVTVSGTISVPKATTPVALPTGPAVEPFGQ